MRDLFADSAGRCGKLRTPDDEVGLVILILSHQRTIISFPIPLMLSLFECEGYLGHEGAIKNARSAPGQPMRLEVGVPT